MKSTPSIRERYGIPPELAIRPIVLGETGAECILLHHEGQLVGRIERGAVPLPGRLLWTMYDASGRKLFSADHPRNFNLRALIPATKTERDNG